MVSNDNCGTDVTTFLSVSSMKSEEKLKGQKTEKTISRDGVGQENVRALYVGHSTLPRENKATVYGRDC